MTFVGCGGGCLCEKILPLLFTLFPAWAEDDVPQYNPRNKTLMEGCRDDGAGQSKP